MSPMTWCNGKQLASTELDRGLQFGDGHFTTLTREYGQLRWWDAHWQRLREASERLAIPLPSEAEVLACLAAIPEPNAVIKILVTRGLGARGYGFTEQVEPRWYVTAAALPPRQIQALVCAVAELRLARSSFFAGLKTLNRLEQVMLTQERQRRAVDELLVCDSEGYVVEAISSNLFLRIDGQWQTPRLDHAGIAGVVRQRILSEQPLGKVHEVSITQGKLGQAQQAFVSNTVLGLRPLAQIGEHKLPESQLPKALTTWWQSSNDLSSAP